MENKLPTFPRDAGVQNQTPSIANRLGSMLADHFILCVIMLPPFMALSLLSGSLNDFKNTLFDEVMFTALLIVHLNKDFLNGRSLGKRLLSLQVIDQETGLPASTFKCFLRNITIPLWPLEVLITLFTPARRAGDLLANTRVESVSAQGLNGIQQELKAYRVTFTVLATMFIAILYAIVLQYLFEVSM